MQGIAISIYLKEFWEYNSQLFWEKCIPQKEKNVLGGTRNSREQRGSIRCGCYFAELAIQA